MTTHTSEPTFSDVVIDGLEASTITIPAQSGGELPPPVDQSGKRPSTRAGRAQQTEARRAERQAKATATAAAKPPRAPKMPKARADVAATMTMLHDLGGDALVNFAKLPMTGHAVKSSGADAAEVWVALVARYPALAKLFETSGEGALWLKLVMAYMPVFAAVKLERGLKAQGVDTAAFAGMDLMAMAAMVAQGAQA